MRAATLAVAVILLLGAARADIIKLKSGETVEGEILEEGEDSIKVKIKVGSIKMVTTYKRSDIASIVRKVNPEVRAAEIVARISKTDPESYRKAIGELKELGVPAVLKKVEKESAALEHKLWKERNKERLCPRCHGDKRVKCLECNGAGKVTKTILCEACKGLGKVTCRRCKGKTKIVCPGQCCQEDAEADIVGPDGRKHHVKLKRGMILFNKGKGRWFKVCPICKGAAEVTCDACTGTGQITCPTCRGEGERRGDAQCPFCKGAGTTLCPVCGGTGLKEGEDEAEK